MTTPGASIPQTGVIVRRDNRPIEGGSTRLAGNHVLQRFNGPQTALAQRIAREAAQHAALQSLQRETPRFLQIGLYHSFERRETSGGGVFLNDFGRPESMFVLLPADASEIERLIVQRGNAEREYQPDPAAASETPTRTLPPQA